MQYVASGAFNIMYVNTGIMNTKCATKFFFVLQNQGEDAVKPFDSFLFRLKRLRVEEMRK